MNTHKILTIRPDFNAVFARRSRSNPVFICLLSSVLCLLLTVTTAYAATEFVSTIEEDGAADTYSTLALWEAATQCDLTSTQTKVFNWDAKGASGAPDNGDVCQKSTDTTVRAKCVHAAGSTGASGQVLLTDIRTFHPSDLTFTNALTAVTGTNTSIEVDDYIWLEADKAWSKVASITDASNLVLTVAYTGTGGTGASYVLEGSFADDDIVQLVTDTAYSITLSNAGDSAIAIAKIDGAWTIADTSDVTIAGWTTSATNYIKVYTTATARHNGTAGTGYKVDPSAVDVNAFTISDDNVTIEGIEVTGVSGSSTEAFTVNGNNTTIAYCLIYDLEDGVLMSDGVHINSNGITVNVYNCIFCNIDRSAVFIQGKLNITAYVYNNTAYNAGKNGNGVSDTIFGFDTEYTNTGSVMYVKNNIAHVGGAFVKCYQEGGEGVYSADSDYNIASDITTTGGSNDIISTTPIFISTTFGSENLHLAGNDTAAIDAGIDLSADFSDDIDSEARPYGTDWDIGADEGGENTAPVLNSVIAGRLYNTDDTITLTFNEAMDTSTIANGCSTLLIRYSDDTAGTNAVVIPTKYATVEWSAEDTVATITLDESD